MQILAAKLLDLEHQKREEEGGLWGTAGWCGWQRASQARLRLAFEIYFWLTNIGRIVEQAGNIMEAISEQVLNQAVQVQRKPLERAPREPWRAPRGSSG